MYFLFFLLLITTSHILQTTTNAHKEKSLFATGNAYFDQQKFKEAILYYQKAVTTEPNAAIFFNLGLCYYQTKQHKKAYDAFTAALDSNPTYHRARLHRAHELYELKEYSLAAEEYYAYIAHDQNDYMAYERLGNTLHHLNKIEESIPIFERAVKLKPTSIPAGLSLGNTYAMLTQYEKAVEAFASLFTHTNNPIAQYNIGQIYAEKGDLDNAIAAYHIVISYDAEHKFAQLGLGHALLQKGDFKNGWEQHKWYLKKTGKNADTVRLLLENNDIAGKIILLTPEGGLGDTLQFIRYAQVLKNMGATIIAGVQKPLIPLILQCPYIDTVIPTGTPLTFEYDARVTYMSLPAVFHSTEATIPKNIPYVYSSPELDVHWKDYFYHDTTYKIGICWQASISNDESRPAVARRGIPLRDLYDLARFSPVTLYSLQQQDGLEQLQQIPDSVIIHTFDDTFDKQHGSFMDTASVIKQLDLVITVDTAIAHLAGAMGKPVWLLLPFSTDWRWIINRADTPWYPTMRIFKQPNPFDWNSVMQDVLWQLTMQLNTQHI